MALAERLVEGKRVIGEGLTAGKFSREENFVRLCGKLQYNSGWGGFFLPAAELTYRLSGGIGIADL